MFKLLDQTNGSTTLPEEIAAQLNVPQITFTYIPPNNDKRTAVASRGRTGAQCIVDLEFRKYGIGTQAKQILMDDQFVATYGTTYSLVIINGDEFNYRERTTEKIRQVAIERGYGEPPLEVAPLLRDQYPDQYVERLGFTRLVIMHGRVFCQVLLTICTDQLYCYEDGPKRIWDDKTGFVFLAP